jgi:hypothetical protein
MKATEKICRKPALATVDEQGEVRYLNRDEFELMKRLNPRLMEMKACGIIYLTEVPEIKKPPSLAVPKQTG